MQRENKRLRFFLCYFLLPSSMMWSALVGRFIYGAVLWIHRNLFDGFDKNVSIFFTRMSSMLFLLLLDGTKTLSLWFLQRNERIGLNCMLCVFCCCFCCCVLFIQEIALKIPQ